MQTMQFLTAHQTETARLLSELKAFHDKPREPHDYATHDGFAAQIRMLKNLGVGLGRVAECEAQLAETAAVIFAEKLN
jgi:hypothetical protein